VNDRQSLPTLGGHLTRCAGLAPIRLLQPHDLPRPIYHEAMNDDLSPAMTQPLFKVLDSLISQAKQCLGVNVAAFFPFKSNDSSCS
jgi:hypothetical protein